MDFARLALLLALAGAGSLGCGPRATPASTPRARTTELAWQDLPKASDARLGAPPSLAIAGGQSARLAAVAVRALVVPPVAETEIELVFDAIPEQQADATFSIDLPASAALSRFAVHDGAEFRDAEPIAPERADKTFAPVEPIFARDPRAARRFSARVLRRAGQRPRLLIGYASTLLAPETPYRVRLMGLPRLDALDVAVRVQKQQPRVYHLSRQNFTPDRDFTLSAGELGNSADFQPLHAGGYALARVLPETTRIPDVTFLVDTSASQPVELPKIADFLRAVSAELAARKSPPLVSVASFDQEMRPIVVRAKPPLTAEQLAPLATLGRLGGTDLTYAVSASIAQGLPHRQIALLSDFENTVIPIGNAFNIGRSELARMDAIVADAAAEQSLLERYARPFGGGPEQPGIIARLDDAPKRVARRLLEPTPSKTNVRVEGASWSSPADAEYSRHLEFTPEIGSAIWVFAEYDKGAPLQVHVNGKAKPAVPPVADDALAALLKRVVGGARLNELLAHYPGSYPRGFMDPADAAQGVVEIARLGKEYGLISPLSSFVVRGGTNGEVLAGRVVDAARTRLIVPTTVREPEKPAPAEAKCPELIGRANQTRAEADEGCPPLQIAFTDSHLRLFAEVRFAPGSNQPLAAASPHLDQVADLLSIRPELAKVRVRTAKKAHAESIVRAWVARGIAAERLEADQLPEGTPPPRKPTPKCPNAGQRVVIDVREMNLAYVDRGVVRRRHPVATARTPSRLARIDALIHAHWRAHPPGTHLDDALALSERWVAAEPKNPLAYVALGNTLHARRDGRGAARAYGSLFDLKAPGAALPTAGALRLQITAPPSREARRHGGDEASEQRWWDIALRTFRKQWEDERDRVEGSRAYAYAALRAGEHREAYGMMFEAAKDSTIAARIELPVFAHLYLHAETRAGLSLEGLLPGRCWLPMQGSVLGAVMSWEDRDSELEVSVSSEKGRFSYDSVLTDRTPGSTLKWLPLPEDDEAYPIRVSVRAQKLGPNGYAFGVLRVLNYNGRGRVMLEQEPFAVTEVGESIAVHEASILQRPQ